MTKTTIIAIYFLIWWVALFAVLPWGVHIPDKAEPGHAQSAPANATRRARGTET